MISQRVPGVLEIVQLRQVLFNLRDALRVDDLEGVARARVAADVESTLELEHDHLVHREEQSSRYSVSDLLERDLANAVLISQSVRLSAIALKEWSRARRKKEPVGELEEEVWDRGRKRGRDAETLLALSLIHI